MSALTASSSTNHTNHSISSSSNLHQAVDHLVTGSTKSLHLERQKEIFQARALQAITTENRHDDIVPTNPLLVGHEMDSQKEYFRRLKFTYLEQEAKRHFLFSITGDEPQGVQPGENEELELSNAEKKAALKATKAEIEGMKQETVKLAKMNSEKHAALSKQAAEAAAIQKQIRDVELELARIKATHPPDDRLTVDQAEIILEEQLEEISRLTEETSATNSKIDVAREDLARTAKELQRMGREREREEARAKEVREGREQGDTKVDEICRWYTASLLFYRSLMGIRSVKAVSENELHLEYDIPSTSLSKSKVSKTQTQPVTLVLLFDNLTKKLANAELRGSEEDVQEAIDLGVATNDVPGLIADILARLR